MNRNDIYYPSQSFPNWAQRSDEYLTLSKAYVSTTLKVISYVLTLGILPLIAYGISNKFHKVQKHNFEILSNLAAYPRINEYFISSNIKRMGLERSHHVKIATKVAEEMASHLSWVYNNQLSFQNTINLENYDINFENYNLEKDELYSVLQKLMSGLPNVLRRGFLNRIKFTHINPDCRKLFLLDFVDKNGLPSPNFNFANPNEKWIVLNHYLETKPMHYTDCQDQVFYFVANAKFTIEEIIEVAEKIGRLPHTSIYFIKRLFAKELTSKQYLDLYKSAVKILLERRSWKKTEIENLLETYNFPQDHKERILLLELFETLPLSLLENIPSKDSTTLSSVISLYQKCSFLTDKTVDAILFLSTPRFHFLNEIPAPDLIFIYELFRHLPLNQPIIPRMIEVATFLSEPTEKSKVLRGIIGPQCSVNIILYLNMFILKRLNTDDLVQGVLGLNNYTGIVFPFYQLRGMDEIHEVIDKLPLLTKYLILNLSLDDDLKILSSLLGLPKNKRDLAIQLTLSVINNQQTTPLVISGLLELFGKMETYEEGQSILAESKPILDKLPNDKVSVKLNCLLFCTAYPDNIKNISHIFNELIKLLPETLLSHDIISLFNLIDNFIKTAINTKESFDNLLATIINIIDEKKIEERPDFIYELSQIQFSSFEELEYLFNVSVLFNNTSGDCLGLLQKIITDNNENLSSILSLFSIVSPYSSNHLKRKSLVQELNDFILKGNSVEKTEQIITRALPIISHTKNIGLLKPILNELCDDQREPILLSLEALIKENNPNKIVVEYDWFRVLSCIDPKDYEKTLFILNKLPLSNTFALFQKVSIIFEVVPEIRINAYAYMQSRLNNNEIQQDHRQLYRLTEIILNYFDLNEMDPLFLQAAELRTVCDPSLQSNPLNPYVVFARLKKLANEELNFKPQAQLVSCEDVELSSSTSSSQAKSELVSIDINFFQKKAKAEAQKVILRGDLPKTVKKDSLKNIFSVFDNRQKSLSENEKRQLDEALVSLIELNYNQFKSSFESNFLKDAYIEILLTSFDNSLNSVITKYAAQFLATIESCLNKSTKLETGKVLTEQEVAFLGICMGLGLQNCITGKQNGIRFLYNTLDIEYQFLGKAKIDEAEAASAFLNAEIIQKILEEIFNDNYPNGQHTFVRDMRGTPGVAIPLEGEPFHIYQYLKNMIGLRVGLVHNLIFDKFTQVLGNIIKKELQETLEIFYKYFTPEYLIDKAKKIINTKLDSASTIRKEIDNLKAKVDQNNKFEEALSVLKKKLANAEKEDRAVYNKICQILGENLKLQTVFTISEETYLPQITTEGVLQLLKSAGYLRQEVAEQKTV